MSKKTTSRELSGGLVGQNAGDIFHGMVYKSIALILALVIVSSLFAQCSASLLSDADARGLMQVTPQALEARRIRGKVSVVAWQPGSGYRLDTFYFYQLLSTKSLDSTPLDNGMLGYFGVNKFTGQVVELNSESPFVEGTELLGMQRKLRAKHCVSPEVVSANENVPLEK